MTADSRDQSCLFKLAQAVTSQITTFQQHFSATIHSYFDKKLPTTKHFALDSAPKRSASSLLTRIILLLGSRMRTARVQQRLALQTMGNVSKSKRSSSYSVWTLSSSVSSSSLFTLDITLPLLIHRLRQRVQWSTSASRLSLTRHIHQREPQCLLLPTLTLTKLLREDLYHICL